MVEFYSTPVIYQWCTAILLSWRHYQLYAFFSAETSRLIDKLRSFHCHAARNNKNIWTKYHKCWSFHIQTPWATILVCTLCSTHASPANINGSLQEEMHSSLSFTAFIQSDSIISALLLNTCRSFLEASTERILLPWPPQNTQHGVRLPIRDMWKIVEFLYIPWWLLNAPHYAAISGCKPQPKTWWCGRKHEALVLQPAPQSGVTVDSTDSVQSAWHTDFLYFQKCFFPFNIFSF